MLLILVRHFQNLYNVATFIIKNIFKSFQGDFTLLSFRRRRRTETLHHATVTAAASPDYLGGALGVESPPTEERTCARGRLEALLCFTEKTEEIIS